MVAEHDPLKQGLKLLQFWLLSFYVHLVAEQDPLKQGLKPISCNWLRGQYVVAEHDPLKQGLIATAVEATNY